MQDEKRISVIYVRPGRRPELIEIEDSLEVMERLVSGPIEEYMPFSDEIAIVCNEEGKPRELPYNRAIYSEEGRLLDIIQGNFFICSAPIESEVYLCLTEEQKEKYMDKFQMPERFIMTRNGIVVKPLEDVKDLER